MAAIYLSGQKARVGDLIYRLDRRHRPAIVIEVSGDQVRVQNIHGRGTTHENRTAPRWVDPRNYKRLERVHD